jgi:hypothetical protein
MKLPTPLSSTPTTGRRGVRPAHARSILPAACEFDDECARECADDDADCFDDCCTGSLDCLIDSSHVEGCADEYGAGTDEFYECLADACSEEAGGYDGSGQSSEEDES